MKLMDLVSADTVVAGSCAKDWQAAVATAIGVLEARGCVNSRYCGAVIDNHQRMGPYMVIAPGIYLAHARPEDGAIATALSIVTLESPVVFGNPDNDPVWLVIGLSAADSEGHLQALAELMELLMDEKRMNALRGAKCAAEIIKICATAQ